MKTEDKENYKKVLRFISDLPETQIDNLAKAIESNSDDVQALFGSVFNGSSQRCLSRCPRCVAPGDNIEWSTIYMTGDQVYQEAHCNNCGTDFMEYYIYAGTEIRE